MTNLRRSQHKILVCNDSVEEKKCRSTGLVLALFLLFIPKTGYGRDVRITEKQTEIYSLKGNPYETIHMESIWA